MVSGPDPVGAEIEMALISAVVEACETLELVAEAGPLVLTGYRRYLVASCIPVSTPGSTLGSTKCTDRGI